MSDRYETSTTEAQITVTDTKTGVEHKFAERTTTLVYDGPLPSAPDAVRDIARDFSGKPVQEKTPARL